MATIEQKNVLIEAIAQVQAILAKRLPLPLNEDQIFLCRMRDEIYSKHYDFLDYEPMINEVLKIRDKYIDLPLI